MKNIKDLTIKVTYRVGLGNVEVPDEVYNELAKAYDEGGDVPEGMMSLKTQKNGLVIIFEKRMQWNGNMKLTIFKMNNKKKL